MKFDENASDLVGAKKVNTLFKVFCD